MGTVRVDGYIEGTADFYQTNSGLSLGSYFQLNQANIKPGSYILEATLNTGQSFAYSQNQEYPTPDLQLSALFNIPVNSGDWNVDAFFYNQTDISVPSDTATIRAGQSLYTLSNGCIPGPNGNDICTGNSNPSFVISHTPGTAAQIQFTTESEAISWGTDTVHFTAVLTDISDAAATPEPAEWGLSGLGLVLLALWKFRIRAE